MTDPLTPEQRETLREKRRMMEFQLARISDLGPQADNWALDVLIGIRDIFVIIDSLPAPKQYTEAELRKAFDEECDKGKILQSFVTSDGRYISGLSIYAKQGWMACASFLEALKE